MRKLLLFSLLVISCSKFDPALINKDNKDLNNEITVEDGHLHFASSAILRSYLDSFLQTDGFCTKSTDYPSVDGFISLAEREKRILSKAWEDAEEEMTPEEYAVYEAEELLIDPILTNVLDTSLVISVEDKVYKITNRGTFAMDNQRNMEELYEAINNFDTCYVNRLENGEYYQLEDEITFINTFGNNSICDEVFDIEESVDEEDDYDYEGDGAYEDEDGEEGNEVSLNNVSERSILKRSESGNELTNNLHNGYNTTEYKWKSRSVWDKFLDSIRGKKVNRSVKFDSKHRVEVTLYDTNYGFFASSGINVKFQKAKHFLGIKYWSKITAPKIAVGFNYIYGKYALKSPMSYSVITPNQFKAYKMFNSKINNTLYNIVCAKTNVLPYLQQWTNDIVVFLPRISLFDGKVSTRSLLNKFYDLPAKYAFNFLKSQALKVVDPNNGIEHSLAKKDPRMLYSIWGNNDFYFTKNKSYISGVKEYVSTASYTVRFDFSIGFYYNSTLGVPTPMVISTFDILNIDAFGAVYYNNCWKGVRFVH